MFGPKNIVTRQSARVPEGVRPIIGSRVIVEYLPRYMTPAVSVNRALAPLNAVAPSVPVQPYAGLGGPRGLPYLSFMGSSFNQLAPVASLGTESKLCTLAVVRCLQQTPPTGTVLSLIRDPASAQVYHQTGWTTNVGGFPAQFASYRKDGTSLIYAPVNIVKDEWMVLISEEDTGITRSEVHTLSGLHNTAVSAGTTPAFTTTTFGAGTNLYLGFGGGGCSQHELAYFSLWTGGLSAAERARIGRWTRSYFGIPLA